MCVTYTIHSPTFSPGSWKAVDLDWGRWVVGRISKAGNTLLPQWNMDQKKMDTMHTGCGVAWGWGVGKWWFVVVGVYVTVRQCAPVLPTHLHRAAMDAGSGDERAEPLEDVVEQKVIGI